MDIDDLSIEELKELGCDRYEMSLEEFEELEENGDEPSKEIRRKRAEENGWDEEEMDLGEFEDLFM